MKILISAGPTIEKIDPARYISNFSSGKMGYALAKSAKSLRHDVVLVSGPVSIKEIHGVKTIHVESTADMACEIRRESRNADLVIMAAAVADYRPAKFAEQKIKKSNDKMILELEKTEDILAWLGRNRRRSQTIVGFSAETENLIENAVKKLKAKKIDWIVANEIGKNDRGFSSDTNAVTLISKKGDTTEIPLMKKEKVAQRILGIIGIKEAERV